MSAIWQVLSAAGPHDAVTGQALAWRDVVGGSVHADVIDPRARGVEPLARLDPGPADLVVLHYSAHAPRLRRVLDLPGRLLLVHHNVTPPRFYWRHHPGVAVACALGRAELPRYARAADALAAVSGFNAVELAAAAGVEEETVDVVPIMLDPARLAERGRAPVAEGGGPLVLCVGRLVPGKRHDLVLEAFAAWRSACAPDARLLCVGEPLTPSYRAFVEGLAGNGVTIAGGVRQPELNAAYAAADVLLSLSEHEGFCVPLLEAFHFGVPVVARPAGGMPEVGGDAVLWTGGPEPPDPAVVAELIELAVRDGDLRAELARRGRERLEERYSPERAAERIRAVVDAARAPRLSASAVGAA